MEEGSEGDFRERERERVREQEADESFIKTKVKMMQRAYEVGLCHSS